MSDYKQNTVGYWLSQLKEPLRSRALEVGKSSLQEHCLSIGGAIDHIIELGDYPDETVLDIAANVIKSDQKGLTRIGHMAQSLQMISEALEAYKKGGTNG